MWIQRSATLREWQRWFAQVWAVVWGTSKKEPIHVPTLKFTVPSDCRALEKGPIDLKDLQAATRFGIKIVRISITEQGRTIHSKDYPDAHDKLQAGYECWILPHLSKHVMIDDEDAVANRLLEACAGIYRPGNEAGELLVEEGTGLHRFMSDFNLKQEDLLLTFLPGRAVTYQGAHAASICTRPFAERLMLHLRKTLVFSRGSGFQCILRDRGILQEDRLVLKILNMRNTFAISPVAVIHGGSGAAGLWEVPETTSTILSPRDRLIFFAPHPLEEEKFQKYIDRLNDENFLSTLPTTERLLSDACLLPGCSVGPVPPDEKLFPVPSVPKAKSKRPTRRGGGGNKKKNGRGGFSTQPQETSDQESLTAL